GPATRCGNAARRIFPATRCSYRRPFGPTPPPPWRHWGNWVDPWRARPVPFWRHGFAPPPATRERFFVALVAWRALASDAINAWNSTPRRVAAVASVAGCSTDPLA